MTFVSKNFRLKFTAITTVTLTVNSGGAGWVDTDAHLVLPNWGGRLYVIAASGTNSQAVGARPHGSSIDNSALVVNGTTILSYTDANGHFDLWRNAAQNEQYNVLGYLQ